MAKPYEIGITDGSGTAQVLNDSYTVTSSTLGYNNTTIDPSSLNVVEGTNTYSFTIAASGTLTLHVTEDGTVDGEVVVGAKFRRCDNNGVEYGTEITSDSSGNAVFNNVPFAATGAPLIYYKQTLSDGEHEFDSTLKNTSLSEETGIVEITNTPPSLRTFNLTDENYSGLPIGTSTITLS